MRPSLEQVIYWDTFFFDLVFKLKQKRPLSFAMRWVSRTGDGYLYPLVALAMYAVDVQVANRFLSAALIGYALQLPLYRIIKNAVKRCRPFQALSFVKTEVRPIDTFSFPSGHTAAAFVMAAMLTLFFPIAATVAVPWAMAIGFSRVFLGVHYPTDVVAGMLLGTACAVTGFLSVT